MVFQVRVQRFGFEKRATFAFEITRTSSGRLPFTSRFQSEATASPLRDTITYPHARHVVYDAWVERIAHDFVPVLPDNGQYDR